MGAVDQAAQLMTTYDTQRVKRKTWKPLFFFLLNVAINNSFLLSIQRAQNPTHAHKEFFQDLIAALFKASWKPFNGPNMAIQEFRIPVLLDLPPNSSRVPSSLLVAVPSPDSMISIPETLVPQFGERPEMVMEKHQLVKLFSIAKSCQSCRIAGKPRVSLAQQDSKTQALRPARSSYGCKVC